MSSKCLFKENVFKGKDRQILNFRAPTDRASFFRQFSCFFTSFSLITLLDGPNRVRVNKGQHPKNQYSTILDNGSGHLFTPCGIINVFCD